jgi:hypothetical protein
MQGHFDVLPTRRPKTRLWILRYALAAAILVGGAANCQNGDSLDNTNGALMCASPAGVTPAPDASTVAGCYRVDGGQICGPSGCSPLCSGSTFELTCSGGSPLNPPPAVDATLGCTVVPVPTPSDVLFYCCPCAK